jgi:CHAD domain-containing protein
MRDALEKKQISHEEDIQKALAAQNDENAHLKLSIVALRDELEYARITHGESIQKLEQSARDEVNQLRQSIQVLREQLEAYEKDQGCTTA